MSEENINYKIGFQADASAVEKAMATVRKEIGLTDEEFGQLTKTIRETSTAAGGKFKLKFDREDGRELLITLDKVKGGYELLGIVSTTNYGKISAAAKKNADLQQRLLDEMKSEAEAAFNKERELAQKSAQGINLRLDGLKKLKDYIENSGEAELIAAEKRAQAASLGQQKQLGTVENAAANAAIRDAKASELSQERSNFAQFDQFQKDKNSKMLLEASYLNNLDTQKKKSADLQQRLLDEMKSEAEAAFNKERELAQKKASSINTQIDAVQKLMSASKDQVDQEIANAERIAQAQVKRDTNKRVNAEARATFGTLGGVSQGISNAVLLKEQDAKDVLATEQKIQNLESKAAFNSLKILSKALSDKEAKYQTYIRNLATKYEKNTEDEIKAEEKAYKAFAAFQDKKKKPNSLGDSFIGGIKGRLGLGGDQGSGAVFAGMLGANLAAQAIFTLSNALHQGIADTLEFERAQGRLQGALGLSATQADKLKSETLAFSSKFNIGTANVSAAALEAVRLGATDAGHSMEFLAEAAKLAKIQGVELETVVKLLGTTQRAYNLDAKDTAKLVDIFQASFKDGGPRADEFANALGRVSTVAKPLGVGFTDLIGLMTQFKKLGLTDTSAADRAATLIEHIDLILRADKGLHSGLGVDSFQKLMASSNGLADAFKKIIDNDPTHSIFGAQNSAFGANAEIPITLKFIEDMVAGNKKIADSAGVAADGLKKIQDNVGEKASAITTRWKNSWIEAIDEVIVAFDKLTPKQTDLHSGNVNKKTLLRPMNERGVNIWAPEDVLEAERKQENMLRNMAAQIMLTGIDFKKKETVGKKTELDKQLSDAQQHYVELNKQQNAAFLKDEQREKEQTAELNSEIDIRMHRLEDSVRTQNEVASKAKSNRKQALENVEGFADNFETGRFNRQLRLTKNPRQQKALLADRAQKLELQASNLVDKFATKSGESMLDSKNLENARGKLEEINQAAQANFEKVAALADQGKASKQQVLTAESAIVAIQTKKLALEERIAKLSKEQEDAAKAKADALKQQFDITKQGVDEALKLKSGKPEERKGTLDAFQMAEDKALKGAAAAGLSFGDQLSLKMKLDEKKQILINEYDRADKRSSDDALARQINDVKGTPQEVELLNGFTILAQAAESLAGKLFGFSGTVPRDAPRTQERGSRLRGLDVAWSSDNDAAQKLRDIATPAAQEPFKFGGASQDSINEALRQARNGSVAWNLPRSGGATTNNNNSGGNSSTVTNNVTVNATSSDPDVISNAVIKAIDRGKVSRDWLAGN